MGAAMGAAAAAAPGAPNIPTTPPSPKFQELKQSEGGVNGNGTNPGAPPVVQAESMPAGQSQGASTYFQDMSAGTSGATPGGQAAAGQPGSGSVDTSTARQLIMMVKQQPELLKTMLPAEYQNPETLDSILQNDILLQQLQKELDRTFGNNETMRSMLQHSDPQAVRA